MSAVVRGRGRRASRGEVPRLVLAQQQRGELTLTQAVDAVEAQVGRSRRDWL